MTFNSTGSTTFSTDGELRAFNFSVATANEKLSVEIEDTVTCEKWRTKDLEIYEFATEHTIITQAQACDYATLIVQCLEQTTTDQASGSMFSSLSKASAEDESRLLCVSSPVQIFTRSVTVEYTFYLRPQPVDHVKRLTRVKQQLEDHVAKLSQECEQLKAAAHQSMDRLVAERKQHEAEVSQLKAAARESMDRMVRKQKQHEAEQKKQKAKVSQLTQEIEQLKAAACESARRSQASKVQSTTSASTTASPELSSSHLPAPTVFASKSPNPRVFLNVSWYSLFNTGEPFTIEIELFADLAPKTVEFFRWLCTGAISSSGTTLKDLDILHGAITCGIDDFATVYKGPAFGHEVSPVKVDTPGILSMVYPPVGNGGDSLKPRTFRILIRPPDSTSPFGPRQEGFGRVVSGMEEIYRDPRPFRRLCVRDCGQRQ